MKTRSEFFKDFFARLAQSGFHVQPVTDSDLAAEVYADEVLFCVVTQDGEIIYETYAGDKARTLEQAAAETRRQLSCAEQPPFAEMERMETVSLLNGPYFKVFESANIALLCRSTGLFGYEFVVCQKAAPKHNNRRFYREQLYYDPIPAQDSFMERSGLKLQSPLNFSAEELRVLVSCCARCVMLDNELDTATENRISALMERVESYLPPAQELSPRHYFQNELGG